MRCHCKGTARTRLRRRAKLSPAQEEVWEILKADPNGIFTYDDFSLDPRTAGRVLENLSKKRKIFATILDSQDREWRYD